MVVPVYQWYGTISKCATLVLLQLRSGIFLSSSRSKVEVLILAKMPLPLRIIALFGVVAAAISLVEGNVFYKKKNYIRPFLFRQT